MTPLRRSIASPVLLVLLTLSMSTGCDRSEEQTANTTNNTAITTVSDTHHSSSPPAADVEPVEFTLAAYNVLNFFDAFDDPYNDDEVMEPKQEASLEKLAGIIAATDADFLGITEMETEGALARFAADQLPDAGYDYIHVNHRIDMRGINNGFMSRIRPGPITIWRWAQLDTPGDQPQTFARDLTEVVVEPVAGTKVHVFIVHFKSKRTVERSDPQSTGWRTAEAKKVRQLVEQRLAGNPDALIAVVGDFNDERDSDPINALLGPGPNGPVLVDVHASLPDDRKITYLHDPYRSQIDYIMVSPALSRCLVPGSAKVIALPDMTTASDHAPVMATFRLPPSHQETTD